MSFENIKIVAVDMDGTLLNDKKEMPKDFIPWVKAHPEVKVVIASGRQYYTLAKDFEEVKDELVFLAENGSIVYEHDEVIYINPMTREDVLACVKIVEGIPGTIPILCGSKAAYMANPDEEQKRNAAIYYKKLVICDNVEEASKDDEIVKIAIYCKDERAKEIFDAFPEIPKGLRIVHSGLSWMDIANAGVTKGLGIQAVQKKHGISPEESMAFGDYMNDYELLQSCTNSYAMANALPAIKEVANFETGSNNEEGVMQILRQFLRDASVFPRPFS